MKAAPEICSATLGICESKVALRRPKLKRASLTIVLVTVEDKFAPKDVSRNV